MKWSDLSYPWQVCFEESLAAYRAGTVPVGAVVLDGEGIVLSRARNRIRDQQAPSGQIYSHKLAHAELNALLSIKGPDTNFKRLSLYTSMEPCPLCMGAIYMSGIRKVYFAARDPFAGSTNVLGTTPYFSRKPVQMIHAGPGVMENLLIGLNAEYGLRGYYGHVTDFFDIWSQVLPVGVAFGRWLFEKKFYEKHCETALDAPQCFELLIEKLIRMEQT